MIVRSANIVAVLRHTRPCIPHARPDVTPDNCDAILFNLAGGSQVIVWRGSPSGIRPAEGQRIRDIRPGDTVEAFGAKRVVEKVELYR